MSILTGTDAKDAPEIVLDLITVLDDGLEGVKVEVRHSGSIWYVRGINHKFSLAVPDETVALVENG